MLKFLCLSVLVAAAHAIVCPPNACQMVRCAAVTAESCGGTIKTNGGFCGCCDACITELAEGEKCMSTLFLGVPSTTQCADGLFCDSKTSTCQRMNVKRDVATCADKLAAVNARLTAQPMLLGLEKPHCEVDGTYEGMQFAGSQAYCVTSDGSMISGYMVNRWETGDHMDCQCARDQYAYQQTGLIGKMFYCDKNGNYASVGCSGSVCYCQDKMGKQVGTSTVGIWEKDSMNC
ncbi:uncharacterized protein LOC132722861 [Ruditapes philippinarum]|uniref:uncharacterized protein LOC132722861 n=1 Tax=Ruditapes philippinarum TaxID=129788 RepID=UPI00295A7185|nr:uncharacterized protein LOC132722861 [Ruditapes philippinarum]